MLLVALTGGIGSGKSEVARTFHELGAEIIDADELARQVVQKGSSGLDQIVERFGNHILHADGSLNREKLAAIVFSDSLARKDLEKITHPLIREKAQELISKSKSRILIYEIPLLVESEGNFIFDLVITVEADEDTQVERLVALRGLSREDALLRIRSQASKQDRKTIANFVINSSGTISELTEQTRKIWSQLLEAALKKEGLSAQN